MAGFCGKLVLATDAEQVFGAPVRMASAPRRELPEGNFGCRL
jgi:hypothetical protein